MPSNVPLTRPFACGLADRGLDRDRRRGARPPRDDRRRALRRGRRSRRRWSPRALDRAASTPGDGTSWCSRAPTLPGSRHGGWPAVGTTFVACMTGRSPTSVPASVIAVAAAIVFVPVVVALVALARPTWFPTGDMAQAELHVRGFWSHPPLVGAAGRIDDDAGVQGSHPGPLLWLAMWPIYALGAQRGAGRQRRHRASHALRSLCGSPPSWWPSSPSPLLSSSLSSFTPAGPTCSPSRGTRGWGCSRSSSCCSPRGACSTASAGRPAGGGRRHVQPPGPRRLPTRRRRAARRREVVGSARRH